MQYINLRAHAKINVALDVVGKREDGYHNIKTVMQSLWLHDRLFIRKIDKFPYKFVCDMRYVPKDDRNIINKAAALIIKNYDIKSGVFIKLIKKIPIAAGLGGGSADCAATLIGLRNLFSLPISNDELMEIGRSLGADVPFCLLGGTALAEGIGERLTPLPNSNLRGTFVVLVRPPVYVSTRDVFSAFNFLDVMQKPDFDGIYYCLANGDVQGLAERLCNSLEMVTVNMHPVIKDIKVSLLRHGALGSVMSGSGPTVFGIFDDKQKAIDAVYNIRIENPKIKEIFLTTMYNPL